MKLSSWYRQTSKQVVIRAVLIFALLAGLVVFRREQLTKEEIKWVVFAALLVLIVSTVNFFGARAAERDKRERKY